MVDSYLVRFSSFCSLWTSRWETSCLYALAKLLSSFWIIQLSCWCEVISVFFSYGSFCMNWHSSLMLYNCFFLFLHFLYHNLSRILMPSPFIKNIEGTYWTSSSDCILTLYCKTVMLVTLQVYVWALISYHNLAKDCVDLVNQVYILF